jgi:hypothetical protein
MSIDEWFKQIREKYASQMQCGKGCTACCYGLFDISLKDAVKVAHGFRELPPDVQERVRSQATEIHRGVIAPLADDAVPTLLEKTILASKKSSRLRTVQPARFLVMPVNA